MKKNVKWITFFNLAFYLCCFLELFVASGDLKIYPANDAADNRESERKPCIGKGKITHIHSIEAIDHVWNGHDDGYDSQLFHDVVHIVGKNTVAAIGNSLID